MALPLALALHLLALYALDKCSSKHHRTEEHPQKEVTIVLLPAAQTPQPPHRPKEPPTAEKPSTKPLPPQKTQNLAAAPNHEAEKHVPTPDTRPISDPADPIIEPVPNLVNLDPAALVKENGYVDSRSDLQKAIEAHGGTVAIQPKDKYVAFAETADFAQIPYCAGKDGLKHDPPHIGPVKLGGILALPFLADAAIRGKCKIIGH